MRILVTGAAGFIGQHVASEADRLGEEVHALIRVHSAGPEVLLGRPERLRVGDLRDEGSLARAVEGIDLLIHLAGLTRARTERSFDDVNALGVGRLLRAVRHGAPQLSRFVLVSSLAATGPGLRGSPRRESDPPEPVSAYGRSKLRGEEILRAEGGGIPWTIIRPPLVYGPWEKDLYTLFKLGRRGAIPITGSGERATSHVFGPDLAKVILALGREPRAAFETYHVAAAMPATDREIVQSIASALGRPIRAVTVPNFVGRVFAFGGTIAQCVLRRPPLLTLARLPDVLAAGWVCATEKVRALVPDAAATSLDDGFRATAAWYRQRGWL